MATNRIPVSIHEDGEYVGAFWAGGFDRSDRWIDPNYADRWGRARSRAQPVTEWIDEISRVGSPSAILLIIGEDIVYLHLDDVTVGPWTDLPDAVNLETVQFHQLDAFIARKLITDDHPPRPLDL